MTVTLAPIPFLRLTNTSTGLALIGGQVFTFAAGTTTPQVTYTDSTGATPNTNPIILNSRGECSCYLDPTLAYKFVVKDVLGNTISTYDNVTTGNLSAFSFTQIGTGAAARGAQEKARDGAMSVKDFKCADGQFVQGDGVHDDTTGIAAALTAAAASGSIYTRRVRFPRGDYLITSQLAWPDGVIWEGEDGRFAASAGNNAQPAAIIWGGAAGVIAIVASTTVGLNCFGFKMRNLRLLSTGANRPLGWVQFANRADSGTGFENVQFQFCSGPAVRFEKGGINVYIRGGRVDQCAFIYWNVQGLDNVSVTDMTQDHNSSTVGESAQFFVGDHTTSPVGAKLSFTFKNINIEGNANLAAGTPYFEFKPRIDASGYPFAFRGTFENVLVKPAGGVTEYTGIKVNPIADRVAFTIINCKLKWTGIPSAPMYDTTRDNLPFVVLAPHGTLDAASPSIEENTIDLRGEVNFRRVMQFGKQAIAISYMDTADVYWDTNPTTLLKGQWLFNPTNVNAVIRKLNEVVTEGTLGTLAGVTGTGTIGTNLLTVNDASNLRMGQWVSVVGDANPHKIALLDYTTGILQLANNLGATVTGAAVTFFAPVYRTHTLLTTLEATVTWDPPSIATGASSTTTVTVTGATTPDFVLASSSTQLAGLSLSGYVSAVDTVTLVLTNNTGGAVDRPSGTFNVKVIKNS